MSYLVDYHTHSIYSTDAEDTIMEMCRSALKKGLKEIVVTDHFEPSAGNENYRQYDQRGYWGDIVRARQAFRGKLTVKLGIELGQPHLFPETSAAVLKDFPYDYVIGSAHKFPNGMDVSEIDYDGLSEEFICEVYLEQLKTLIEWGNFDCIGHLDLIKRYSARNCNRNIRLTCRYELLKEVLRLAIESGKGLEINTSGLRQEAKETMPGLDILSLYRELGGEILTIGSDAHNKADVGKGITEALALAREAGFYYLTVFNDRKPDWIRISEEKNVFAGYWQASND